MREITNITSDPHQKHSITLEESEIILVLRFYPTIQQWCFNVEYKGKEVKGPKLSLGVLHITNTLYPFDFIVLDMSGNGTGPFRADDFSGGRCKLYMLDPADMERFRGAAVAF